MEGFFLILSFFVGYILSFGLVRLRTIRLSARAGAHIVTSSARERELHSITDVIIKPPDGKWNWGGWMTSCPKARGLGILVIFFFFEKEESWDLSLGEASWDLKLGYGMHARLLGQWVGILTLGRPVHLGSWLKDDVGTLSMVKKLSLSLSLSLSPRVEKSKKKKKKKKKKLNVSYLN